MCAHVVVHAREIMQVHVCIYKYTCVRECVCVCKCLHLFQRAYVCVRASVQVCVCLRECAIWRACTAIFLCICACLGVHECMCVLCRYLCVHVHVHYTHTVLSIFNTTLHTRESKSVCVCDGRWQWNKILFTVEKAAVWIWQIAKNLRKQLMRLLLLFVTMCVLVSLLFFLSRKILMYAYMQHAYM